MQHMVQVRAECFLTCFLSFEEWQEGSALRDLFQQVPRVREDSGYPPLVTPTSQIVGTQAVFNVITGRRYKMCTNEFKSLLK